jgi:glycerol-3-phosphate dehydrogenase (NAD(P)+)
MNVCLFWVGAFGFAMLKLIEKSPAISALYAYEQDMTSLNYLKTHNKHPYFFEWVEVNSRIIFTDDYESILPRVDIIIIAIPSQFILPFLPSIKKFLKPGVIVLNLSKGINNMTLKTIAEDTAHIFAWHDFEYAILSGGMIAREVVEWKPLGAQIGVTHKEAGEKLKRIFEGTNLEVEVSVGNIQNIELYASLKNVIALMIGYYEWLWYSASTLGYYFCKIYKEVDVIIHLLWGNDGYDFSDFAVGGDLIATCFWDSRNRYLWKMIGSGKSPQQALDILTSEKKRAEGYETLKWIYKIIQENEKTPLIREFAKKVLIP